MLLGSILLLSALTGVLSCTDHNSTPHNRIIQKRQLGTNQISQNSSQSGSHDWSYVDSFDWGQVSPDYELCQIGTQQSPIALNLNQGLSRQHRPDFLKYLESVNGTFYNWGHGPAFTIDHQHSDWNTLPSMSFGNETVYLKGWHPHTPADHSVSVHRSKGEIHLVHIDRTGHERAVVAVRLEPGRADTNFLPDLSELIGIDNGTTIPEVSWDPRSFLKEVDYLNEYWRYKGSLTSPPCREGIQWFVARAVIYTGVTQMTQLLRISSYSTRAEQDVWLHEVNA